MSRDRDGRLFETGVLIATLAGLGMLAYWAIK